MIKYITKEQVDVYAANNDDWTNMDDSEKERAVTMANAYLSAYGLAHFSDYSDLPSAITTAGSELALLAAKDDLFTDQNKKETESTVQAGPVRISKKYSPDHLADQPAVMGFIKSLLAPYRATTRAFRMDRG